MTAPGRLAPNQAGDGTIESGRAYVRAYVEFIHYVERLYEAGALPVEGHFETQDNEEGSPTQETAIELFKRRVFAYVELHRRLEGPLPPLTNTRDPRRIQAAEDAMVAALRSARTGAKPADIFSPEVSEAFRRRIAAALKGYDIGEVLALVDEENPPHATRPRVNEPYPADRGFSMMLPCILRELPQLPEELQYRFAGRDLLLLDVHANFVVDILPNALPAR